MNNQTKHTNKQTQALYTPGPWHAPQDKSFYVVEQNTKEFVCNASTQANAQLIAAAPELLAALKALVAQCAYMGAPESHADMRAAYEAINKATG